MYCGIWLSPSLVWLFETIPMPLYSLFDIIIKMDHAIIMRLEMTSFATKVRQVPYLAIGADNVVRFPLKVPFRRTIFANKVPVSK